MGSTMADDVSGALRPGETRKFAYVGNLIPNQVNIQNLSAQPASYKLESGTSGWMLYGNVAPSATAALLVQWPSGIATFSNGSPQATIVIWGDGIRPFGPGDES
jgi:hypothetical protein